MAKRELKPLKYNPHLDGLRGIAFLLVFLYHIEGNIFPYGWIGVDLFFVLSGFLITQILRKSLESQVSVKKYLKTFFIRRMLRIFPLYYLALFIFLYLIPFVATFFDTQTNHNALTEDAIWFVTYLQNYIMGLRGEYFTPGYLNHFWTLSIEEHFYLIWPFLLLIVKKYKNIVRFTIVLIVLITILRILSVIIGTEPLLIKSATHFRLDSILYGSLLGLIIQENQNYLNFKQISSKKIKFIFFFSIIVCLIIGSLIGFSYYQTYIYSILSILFVIIISIIHFHSSSVNFLSHRILVYVGKLSYGCYVWHYPIILLFKNRLDNMFFNLTNNVPISNLFRDIILLILTILVSHYSYKLFEKQFLKLKKKFQYS